MHQLTQRPNLLVCTDIFGITPALQHWLAQLPAKLTLVSPYQQSYQFEHDEAAYQHFSFEGGINAYQQKLAVVLSEQTQPWFGLGFSAGAAVLWSALSATGQQADGCQRAWLFYGGQIRHQAQLQPLCPTTLIWAQEDHFDVVALHQQLASKAGLQSELTKYRHGFINPASSGYQQAAACYYQQKLAFELAAN